MIVRSEKAGEAAQVRAVLLDAFVTPLEADLVEALRRDGDIATALVAEKGGRLVGIVVLSRLVSPATTLALAPLAVRGDMQGEGVGGALMRTALGEARRLGATMIFVLGAPGFYGRFGFATATASPYPCLYAGPHFMAVALRGAGPPVAPVVYPRAFEGLG